VTSPAFASDTVRAIMAGPGVDRLLDEARQHLHRVTATEAASAAREDALLVDIRPLPQREREGEIPGALIIGRNVLEWRLDPAGRNRLPEAENPRRPIVVLCSQGFASSFAARSLQLLGWEAATDLVGGFRAWAAAGLPVQPCAGPSAEEASGSVPDEPLDQAG
jgi:rhodanese-related sulfurtransferase